MAFLQCSFHSDVLGRACSMNVILPQKVTTQIGMTSSGGANRRYPVLYLLHGLSDDHTIWSRRTSIERYAAEYELAVVMPDGERGFYTDLMQGPRYWTMLTEELPAIAASFFPISTRREDTFVAGLSMGGYGALKCALRLPERYAAAVALSSVADVRSWLENCRMNREEATRIFGTVKDLIPNRNDLFALAEETVKLATPPRLMMVCGTEDGLLDANRALRSHLESLHYPGFRYEEGPGAHSWGFWDHWIVEGLKFLMEGRSDGR